MIAQLKFRGQKQYEVDEFLQALIRGTVPSP